MLSLNLGDHNTHGVREHLFPKDLEREIMAPEEITHCMLDLTSLDKAHHVNPGLWVEEKAVNLSGVPAFNRFYQRPSHLNGG